MTLNKAKELAGYTGKLTTKQIREDKYARLMKATKGWATMNRIMTNNVDGAHHGLQVTPTDKSKVLFRWKKACE